MNKLEFDPSELVYIVELAQNKINNANEELTDLVEGSDYTLLSAEIDRLVNEFATNLNILSKAAKSINRIPDEVPNDVEDIVDEINSPVDDSIYSNLPCAECSIRNTIF